MCWRGSGQTSLSTIATLVSRLTPLRRCLPASSAARVGESQEGPGRLGGAHVPRRRLGLLLGKVSELQENVVEFALLFLDPITV